MTRQKLELKEAQIGFKLYQVKSKKTEPAGLSVKVAELKVLLVIQTKTPVLW